MNSVSVIGHVAQPPELRVGLDGQDVCAMRLAVPRVARAGTREPGVVYVDVASSGWQARELHQRLAVGARIGVSGRLELDEWVSPEGERMSRYEVLADQLELLDPVEPQAARD